MAQSPAVLNWSAVACTLRGPQSVAPVPEYSCSFCCTASGDFAEDVALDNATGPVDFLAVRRKTVIIRTTRRMIRTIPKFFMAPVIVNLSGAARRTEFAYPNPTSRAKSAREMGHPTILSFVSFYHCPGYNASVSEEGKTGPEDFPCPPPKDLPHRIGTGQPEQTHRASFVCAGYFCPSNLRGSRLLSSIEGRENISDRK